MLKYPNINNTNFYEQINKIYHKYKIQKQLSYDNYCNLIKPKLQSPQEFVSQFINPHTPYTRLLIYHKIGLQQTIS